MLTLEHVSKSYGGLPVLNDLSLTLSEGEILALIGPSGCGKSTLLNIISGLVRPDAGSVSGADVKMSYMFQSARLLPWRTGPPLCPGPCLPLWRRHLSHG